MDTVTKRAILLPCICVVISNTNMGSLHKRYMQVDETTVNYYW
jgi:hypothetical protein